MTLTTPQHVPTSVPNPRGLGKWPTAETAFLWSLLVTIGVTVLTLTTSPPAWWDECQIIDYGRTALRGADVSYGTTITRSGRVCEILNYVGCVLQEFAYHATSGSMIGPRLTALMGALFAAVALRAWLKAVGALPWVATLLACTFLWDPLVASSYRGARVDCWCIGFMVTAFFCVRKSATAAVSGSWLAGAGVFVALGGMTWASAILLVPLLLQELFACDRRVDVDITRHDDPSKGTLLHACWRIGVVALSASFVTAILLIPVADRVYEMVRDLHDGVTAVTNQQANQKIANVTALLTQFMKSPILPASALVGAMAVGPRRWLIAFFLAVCGVVATRTYNFRVVYLLPYLVFGWAVVADRALIGTLATRRLRFLVHAVAALMLLWGVGVTLITRTAVALIEHDRRNPSLAEDFVQKLVGDRTGRVLLGTWTLYHPLRARGWKYWGPFDKRVREDVARNLEYDLVIHDEAQGMHRLHALLIDRGYTRQVYQLPTGDTRIGFLTNRTPGYGPYVVYTHPDWAGPDLAETQADE